MRGTSSEENIQAKKAYEHLAATCRTRVFAYRSDSVIFLDNLFREAVQTYGQQIS